MSIINVLVTIVVAILLIWLILFLIGSCDRHTNVDNDRGSAPVSHVVRAG